MKTCNRPPIDGRFRSAASRMRFQLVSPVGEILAGTNDKDRAEALLAVFSHDSTLPGYELHQRGQLVGGAR